MSIAASSISDVNQLIESQNPFDRPRLVRTHDIWEQKFPDVHSINGHISDAIFHEIEQIRSGQRSVLGVTIKAEKGFGKSHLISRIRRHSKETGSFFVYMSETDYSDLDRINSQFLNTLAISLKQMGSQNVMQWQELATLMLNQVYNTNYLPEHIVKQFSGALAKHSNLIDQLTAKICQLKSDIKDPYVVQAILWTLSPTRSIYAINWLAGRELTPTQADAMGLPVMKDEDREFRALGLATQVLDLIGDYQTIVICFDEVEPKNTDSRGLTTPQVVALLAKDLYSKLKRGILMMAIYPQTWSTQIKGMPQAESVIDRIGEKSFDLKPLNSDNIVALVSAWLQPFYADNQLTPPTPVYPFDENDLLELGKERPIIRDVLKWCCTNWGIEEREIEQAIDPLHQVEMAFQQELLALDGALNDYLDNSAVIADALFLGFWSLEGQKIGQVLVEEVQAVEAQAVDQKYLSFRVVGQDNGKLVKIGVSVVQESSAQYVSAALKRLINYKKFDFTRGCLVRSKAINPRTHGHQYLDQLVSELGGEWVLLKEKALQPLLAISFVYDACEEYEITEEQVFEFMAQRKIAETNYLIREILSDPSGEIPADAVDDDLMISGGNSSVQTNPSTESDELLVAFS